MSAGRRSKFGFHVHAAAALGAVAIALLLVPDKNDRVGNPDRFVSADFWQGFTSPGDLSQAHAFLETNCSGCHTPLRGPEAAQCILCHGNNEPLLQRQPTAFHAQVDSCRECHAEHLGLGATPTTMDHSALTKIGLRQRDNDSTSGKVVAERIQGWIRVGDRLAEGFGNPYLSDEERVLDCAACHTLDDRHFGLFGMDCAACHSTTAWSLPDFRHPPPTNVECSQCHQAPPSHYMKHFDMISRPVAVKPEAQVEQCHLCHQTTSWPDIKGVGWYKHH